jgi:hypothetical protein
MSRVRPESRCRAFLLRRGGFGYVITTLSLEATGGAVGLGQAIPVASTKRGLD